MIEGKERVHINLARLKKGGDIFEVDVDPDLAVRFKRGEAIDIHDILKAGKVFKDAQKGLVASETRIQELFGTTDSLEVAKAIIKEGEIQLTAEYRAQLREAKKRRIIDIIHHYGTDPRTKTPHPVQRIEAALEEAKVKIDEHKSAEDQVKDVVDGLKRVLPITFAKKEIWVRIPAQFASKTYSTIKAMSTIMREEWKSDGSWEATIEIPGGLEEEFYDKINKATKGNVETKLVKEK